MSKDNVIAFGEVVKGDPALQEEVKSLGQDLAGCVAMGKREGYEFTLDELKSVMRERNVDENRQLDDDELDNLAGGVLFI